MLSLALGQALKLANNELVVEAYRGPHFNVIYRIDIAHRITQWVRTKDHFVSNPVWSPDGRQIAFVNIEKSSQTAIYIMDAEGGGLHKLNDSSLSEFAPTWSPDGHQLAFIRRYPSAPELMVTELRTHETRRLTNGDGNKHNATWSPDSQTLTFANETSGVTGLYNLNVKSGETQLVFSPSTDVDYPEWSPDGRYLLYVVTRGRATGIYLWDTQRMQRMKSILINPIFFHAYSHTELVGGWALYCLYRSNGHLGFVGHHL